MFTTASKYAIGVIVVLVLLVLVYMNTTQANPQKALPVYGNDGNVSGNTYCGGVGGKSWNDELPFSWNGAKCQSSLDPRWGCDIVPTTIDPNIKQAVFTCVPTGTGWNMYDMRYVKPV